MEDEFLIFSDIHYYRNSAKSISDTVYITSWVRDQIAVTDQIFSYAEEHNIKTIVFNGDLFEEKTRISQEIYNLIWSKYKTYYEDYIQVIMNSGNHDLFTFSRNSSLKPFSQIVQLITSPTSFYTATTEYKFIPYGMLDNNLEPNSSYGIQKHILFIHEDVYDLQYGNVGTKSKSIIDPKIFNKWDIVFLGHIHRPQEYKNIVVVGSPMIQDFGEEKEVKRFLHYKDGKYLSIPTLCPKFLSLPGLSDKIKNKIKDNEKDFFRIEISPEQLSDDIFKKFNVYPNITKSQKRELRMVDSGNDEDDISKYLEIIETKLDKKKLEEIGKEIINEVV